MKRTFLYFLKILPIAAGLIIITISATAPILEYLRLPSSADWFEYLSFTCHRLPTRCFFIFTSPMALCSRCFGLYLGFLLACIALSIKNRHRISPLSFFFFILPCTIDGATQYLGMRISNNLLRFATGFTAGIGFSLLLFPLWQAILQSPRSVNPFNFLASVEREP